MTSNDAAQALCYLDTDERGARQEAIASGIDALKRLAAIRAAHESGAVTTDNGTVVYASIHGWEMHRLLFGDLDE